MAPPEWRECRSLISQQVVQETRQLRVPPATDQDWYRKLREDNLCMLKRATVFHDPLGEWTQRRQSFATYPPRVWAWRTADELYRVWHFGQYNFLDRLRHRGDLVSISIALGTFSQAAMQLSMVLAEEFSPFWKWLAAEFRRLPDAEALDSDLTQLAKAREIDEQAHLVASVCDALHTRVVSHYDLVSATSRSDHPLWNVRQDILEKFPKP